MWYVLSSTLNHVLELPAAVRTPLAWSSRLLLPMVTGLHLPRSEIQPRCSSLLSFERFPFGNESQKPFELEIFLNILTSTDDFSFICFLS